MIEIISGALFTLSILAFFYGDKMIEATRDLLARRQQLTSARLEIERQKTPAAVERERLLALTAQVERIESSTSMSSADKRAAIEALTRLHGPDADELAMRAAMAEVGRLS